MGSSGMVISCGTAFILLTLIVLQAQPAESNVTVAADGSGNYRTISEAVRAAPNNSKSWYFININAGVYNENVSIPETKTYIALIGSGAEKTKLTYNLNGSFGINYATLAVWGNNFMLQHLAVENSAGPEGGQAVALLSNSNESVFYKCVILGYQDTLFARGGSQFYRECDIYGTVDFIFGSAKAVFQNCNMYARLRGDVVFTAQARDAVYPINGYTIQNCTLTTSPELTPPQQSNIRAFLGRAWRDFATVVVMESFLGDVVDPKGWTKFTNNAPVDKLTFWEYNNRGAGANTTGRVTWPGFKVLHQASEAEPYTVSEFVEGDSWIPQTGVPYYGGLTTS